MAKRGNNEGSIYQRRDGRWVGALTLDDGKRKYMYGKTRRAVQQALTTAMHARQTGTLPTGPSQTVRHFLERWLEDAVKSSVRPRTYEAYALNVRRVLPHLGSLRLAAVTPAQMQACYGALLSDGLSRRSVEQCHTVLHRAFRQAAHWGLIGRNPTEAAAVPRPARREMQTLTAAQVQALFASSADDRLHALWIILAKTGMRLGEASGLRWDDVDLAQGRIAIRRALQRQRSAGLVFVEPKTARSRRTVHVGPSTIAALREHKQRQNAECLRAGPAWSDRGLIFCNTTGAPLDPARINEAFHAALATADLPRVRVHDLRHTAATLLLAQGVHPKVVQEMLGHSTITLTLDTYSHVVPAMHREAADRLEALLAPDTAAT